MTPDQWIFLIGGLAIAWCAYKAFVARTAPVPAAQPPPAVRARVVDDHPIAPDATQLLGQLNHAVVAQGVALAYQRKAAEMIEAHAAGVTIPWAAPATPKPDPPKA